MAKLTDKQERFCLEYIVDLNATQAAKRAGYSDKTAHRTGAENMQKHAIQEKIQELQKKHNEPIEQKYTISREIILDKLARHATAEIKPPKGNVMNRDYYLSVYNSMSRNQIKAIEVIINLMGYNVPEKTSEANGKSFTVTINPLQEVGNGLFNQPEPKEDADS